MDQGFKQLAIELLADGGIRILAPEHARGLASVARARQWVAAAVRDGAPVRITGELESPLGRAVVEQLARPDENVTLASSVPEPWPRRWTTLQTAAAGGLDEIVEDLLARGATIPAPWRRDHTPYRLAMYGGHFGVMRALRDAGAQLPPGLHPPADLPDAVVARAYAPALAWWLGAVCALIGVAGTLMLAPFFGLRDTLPLAAIGLYAAAVVALILLMVNAMSRFVRLAVDGPYLSVRSLAGWRGPVDLRRLVALGFTPSLSARHPACWQLIQREAGSPYRRLVDVNIERGPARLMRDDSSLRAIKIYQGAYYRETGLQRYLATYIDHSQICLGPNARLKLAAVDPRFM